MVHMTRHTYTDKQLFELKSKPIYYKIKNKKMYNAESTFDIINLNDSYIDRFKYIMANCEININPSEERFIYFLDMNCIYENDRGVVFDNISVDYRKIINHGLRELKYKANESTNKFCEDYNAVIDGLVLLAERIKEKAKGFRQSEWFDRIVDSKASGIEEALQRVLFLNQVLWQTNHPLMGLGLMDTMLAEVYEADKKQGNIDKEKITQIIEDFYIALHREYWYKSHALLGDTGQLVIVGKTNPDGNYFCNDLSYAFIDALKKIQLPDPKVLVRVSDKTPDSLLRCAIECIATGVGCPLFANDNVIIPLLIEDGIEREDAYCYATSACWEPLIAWKCAISNNLTVLNYMKSLENMLLREPLDKIDSFDMFLERYYFYLKWNISAALNSLSLRRFSYDPLVSVFIGGCKERKKDVSAGGAFYNDYGMTTVAISNVVNSLYNIKKFVYDESMYTLKEVREFLLNNYEGHEEIAEMMKRSTVKFGNYNNDILSLVNDIMRVTRNETKGFRNYLGGKLKFGLSSPAYIDASKNTLASFDGRRKGEPFHVHISTESSEAYTELVNFASSIEMSGNSYNGNVVDFITSPSFITDNKEKFLDFIKGSIKKGFFEMQIGVISSDMLLKAKDNPDEFPNLIVRVWGFSAYFKDLPDSYKNVIIRRALENEGKTA